MLINISKLPTAASYHLQLNLMKSYFLNRIYPTDVITFLGSCSSEQNHNLGSNETGTGGLG